MTKRLFILCNLLLTLSLWAGAQRIPPTDIRNNPNRTLDCSLVLVNTINDSILLDYYILENIDAKKPQCIGYLPSQRAVIFEVRNLDEIPTISSAKAMADDFFAPFAAAVGLPSADHNALFADASVGGRRGTEALRLAATASAKQLRKHLPKVKCKRYALVTGFAEFSVSGPKGTPFKFQGDEAIQAFIEKAAKQYGYKRSVSPEILRERLRQGDAETKDFVSAKLTGR